MELFRRRPRENRPEKKKKKRKRKQNSSHPRPLGRLDDRRDELEQEARDLEQRRVEVVEKVHDQALDVAPVVVLVRHDHQVPVPQRLGAVVDLAVLQAQDLLDVLDLGVAGHGRRRRVAHVEQLAAQREHAEAVAAGDRQPADHERLGRVALGQDQRAVLRVAPAGVVGVHQLGQADDARPLGPVRLLERAVLLERRERQHALGDARVGDLPDELLGEVALGAERARPQRQRLLGLRVEGRVLDHRVDEHAQVGLDHERLGLAPPVLLDQRLAQRLGDLVDDQVDVRAPLGGADPVDERDLLELPVRRRDDDLPAVADLDRGPGGVRARQVQPDVLAEGADGHALAVERDGAAAAEHARDVVGALAHQVDDVVLEPLHAELRQVGLERDAGPVRAGEQVAVVVLGVGELVRLLLLLLRLLRERLDLGSPDHAHVPLEHLAVGPPALAVGRLDDELGREDVGELGAVAVAPARDLLLGVVVVGRSEQVAEDQLRDVDLLRLVHLDGHARAVVPHADPPALGVDLDVERAHRLVADLVVRGVDEDLVEDLVEPRHERDVAEDHRGAVVDPELGLFFFVCFFFVCLHARDEEEEEEESNKGAGEKGVGGSEGSKKKVKKEREREKKTSVTNLLPLRRPDVGVGPQQDVLELRLLLVDVLDGLFLLRGGGGGGGGLGGDRLGAGGVRLGVFGAWARGRGRARRRGPGGVGSGRGGQRRRAPSSRRRGRGGGGGLGCGGAAGGAGGGGGLAVLFSSSLLRF